MKKLYFYYFLFVVLLFALYESVEIRVISSSLLDSGNGTSTRYYVFALTFFSALFCMYNPRPKLHFSFGLVLLTIFVVCMTFAHGTNSPTFSASLNLLSEIVMPLFLFFFFFQEARYVKHSQVLLCFIIAYVIIFQAFMVSYQIRVLYSNSDFIRITEAYVIYFLLPFFLITRNNVIKIISIVLVFLIMLFSMKRGGLVSLTIGLAVYYVVYTINQTGRFKFKPFIYVLIFIAVVYAIITYGMQEYVNDFLFRMTTVMDDEGSGRISVYDVTWKMITEASFISMIIGHGWNAVLRDSPVSYSAHNDFLEMAYDFGIIGLSIYLTFFFRLYRTMFTLIRYRSYGAAPFAFSVIVFTVNSMVSHVILYPFNMIAFTMVWGYILGKEQDHHIIRKL